MSKEKQQRHSELVQHLEERVKSDYMMTMTEVEIRDPETGLVVGEIDLVGIIGDRWDLYEVKVGNNLEKARKQLFNLKRYLDGNRQVDLYYFSGTSRKIIRIG